MSTHKALQEEVNCLSKVLQNKQVSVKKINTKDKGLSKQYSKIMGAYAEIIPYDKAVVDKYNALKQLLAENMMDKVLIDLYDQAIMLMDKADIARKKV